MQLELWHILVLAVVQGVAEFLPISSSGHVVIVAALLAPSGGAEELDVADVNIVLHIGTLFSILLFYWRRILRLLSEDRRTISLLVVASIPATVVGIPLKLWFDEILGSPLIAGLMLPFTGLLLFLSSRFRHGKEEYQTMSFGQAFTIGLAQAVAVLPGISRSGTTISTALRLGLAPQAAASFSFLMAIIAIGGAGLIEAIGICKNPVTSTPLSHLLLGAAVSFAIGLGTLAMLVRWLERGRFQFFGWWCIAAGISIVIWQLTLK